MLLQKQVSKSSMMLIFQKRLELFHLPVPPKLHPPLLPLLLAAASTTTQRFKKGSFVIRIRGDVPGKIVEAVGKHNWKVELLVDGRKITETLSSKMLRLPTDMNTTIRMASPGGIELVCNENNSGDTFAHH